MRKLIVALLATLMISTSAIAADVGFQFSYTTEPGNSYIIYDNGIEFCWFQEADTVVDLEAETPSGLPLHTIICEDTLGYGEHTLNMTAVQYGVESYPSNDVVWNKIPVSSEVLIPVIIKMFREAAESIQE